MRVRTDLTIGVVLALLVVLVAPGLAIVALIVLLTLLACLATWLVQRRRARRDRCTPARGHP